MSNLTSFLKSNAEKIENQKIVISNRFKDKNGENIPFEVRALTEKSISKIRQSCTKKIKAKSGLTEETDVNLMMAKMIAESVVYPDLQSSELQDSYNVVGAEELVQAMLTGGEYTKLATKIQEISGYNEDINELVEQAKN